MKANKVLLGSFLVAGLAACSNEEIIEVAQNNGAVSERPQVELELSTPAETRMARKTDDKMQVAYTSNDVLGAVLVDGGYNTESNNVNWSIVDGHVGNNKWAYTNGKFQTKGTTAVGAWLFYTKYNEEMTTTRGGVKFNFPQIQEGAADYEWVANNNINFFISPVLAIDGYEGEEISLPISYASVHNSLRMAFDFSAVGAKKVQKIVVSATDKAGTAVKFPTEYLVKNTNVPMAKLSINGKNSTVNCPDHTPNYDNRVKDQETEIETQYAALTYQNVDWSKTIDYKPAVVCANETTAVDYLVVDFDKKHDDAASDGGMDVAADGKFSAVMLMPAGVYGSISFDIYTDKGIYTKTVSTRNAYRENLSTAKQNRVAVKGEKEIFLRPQYLTVLSDIENVNAGGTFPSNKDDILEAEAYIKVATNDASTKEGIITKTADLINLINSINKAEERIVNVIAQAKVGNATNGVDDKEIPAHSVVINEAVAGAMNAKVAALGKGVQLIFQGAELEIKGGSNSPIELQSMTFNNGCKVTTGAVKVTSEVSIPTGQVMKIESGSVDFSLSDQYNYGKLIYPIEKVEAKSTVVVSGNVTVGELVNSSSLTVAGTLNSTKVTNKGAAIVNADKTWNVNELSNEAEKTISNKGTMNVGKVTNYGTVENSTNISVTGVFTNHGTINNGDNEGSSALILAEGENGTVNNVKGATITNWGSMYCYQGNNTINNTGTINAKKLSTTYITTNSAKSELITATNAAKQTMGSIVLDRRNEDISVTTPDRQGYIQFAVPAETAKLDVARGDKFNKIVLSGATELTSDVAGRVNYIVVNTGATELVLPAGSNFQEIEFNAAKTDLYADNTAEAVTVAHITIAEKVQVKVPTENQIYVYDVNTGNSVTVAEIENKDRLVVGGDLWTVLAQPTTGIFASGDGNTTAFHWETVREGELAARTAAELKAAIAEGGSVTLLADVELDKLLLVEKDVELNLNGKTLTTSTSDAGTDDITVAAGASLTVKNGNIATANTAFYVNGGSLTLKDCTITAKNVHPAVYATNSGVVKADNVTVNSKITAFSAKSDVTMSLTDCNVTVTSGTHNVVGAQNAKSLTIEGGSYTGVLNDESHDVAYVIALTGVTEAKINTTVSGGNGAVTVLQNSTVSFTGGSYSGVKACGLYVNGGSTVTYPTTGCTFSGVEGNVVVGETGTVNEIEYSKYTKVL